MKKIIFLLLVIALSACSFGSPSELERNRQAWQSANVSHYRFSLYVGCFCAFRNQMPLTVEVKDGDVISLTYPDGILVAADDPNMDTFSKYDTVDQLFKELETGKAEEVTVTYDGKLGFPNEIRFDYIKAAMDDEISIMVTDFEALK